MPGVQEAVDRGLFRERRAADAPPNMGAIQATAQEIASGMSFLHEQGIVHGDLAGGTPQH
jgi:serine/threonine protein kinase